MATFLKNAYNVLIVEDFEERSQEKEMKKAIKKLNEIDRLKKKSVLTLEESEKLSMESHYFKIAYPEPFEKKPSEKEQEYINKKKQKRERENALKESERVRNEQEKKERREQEERLLKEKENAKKEAERVKKEAERQRKEAEKERQEIQRQRKEAEKERIRIEQQNTEADAEVNEELEKQIKAEMKKRKREKDKARKLANKEAKKIAEKLEAQRAEAERIRKEKEKEQIRMRIMQSLLKSELEKEWALTLIDNNNNINKTYRMLSLKYHPDKNPQKKLWAEEQQKVLNGLREAASTMRTVF